MADAEWGNIPLSLIYPPNYPLNVCSQSGVFFLLIFHWDVVPRDGSVTLRFIVGYLGKCDACSY